MANLNKVILIGRLTRDPESRTFSTGGKVTKFGFAVTNRKKNTQTGQWEDEPMFIDCEAFNRGEFGKLADTIETVLQEGQPDLHRGQAAAGPVGRQDDRPEAVEAQDRRRGHAAARRRSRTGRAGRPRSAAGRPRREPRRGTSSGRGGEDYRTSRPGEQRGRHPVLTGL